jgi:GDP-L-fucose synthase
MHKQSQILITGGAGLVGSALTALLNNLGFSRVVSLGKGDCDLLDLSKTRQVFKSVAPDVVFHLAARVYGIMGNMKNQAQSIFENTIINTNVVDASAQCGVKKIIAMGTGAVYPADPRALPLAEDMIFDGRPHASEGAYAQSKRLLLATLEAYHETYGMNYAFVISCNLFGPKDKFDPINGHVVPALIYKFYEAKQNNGFVSVWGDGSAKRDFMFVEDAARVLHHIAEQHSGPINIGSGTVFSIREIVDSLGRITGLGDRVRWDASMPNGQSYRGYDLQKIQSSGFKCRDDINSGLEKTWKWYCENAKK